MDTSRAIATALYQTVISPVAVYLVPVMIVRRGKATMRWQWFTQNGTRVSGFKHPRKALLMIHDAMENSRFNNIATSLMARSYLKIPVSESIARKMLANCLASKDAITGIETPIQHSGFRLVA